MSFKERIALINEKLQPQSRIRSTSSAVNSPTCPTSTSITSHTTCPTQTSSLIPPTSTSITSGSVFDKLNTATSNSYGYEKCLAPSATTHAAVVENVNEVPIEKVPDSYVGFATLPDQLHRRAVAKGFSFNLMVVGESGLGKSTFINSLFLTELYGASSCEKTPIPCTADSVSLQIPTVSPKTVSVRSNRIRLTESSVSLELTLIDTPGFGDALDNTGCWEPIVNFIDQRYEDYLNAETSVDRSLPITDNRVHCCLYFIAPTGHGLRSIDIELMKHLDNKVNIIPIVAKSDTLTSEELTKFKEIVRDDLRRHQINIFDFTECNSFHSSKNPTVSNIRNLESAGKRPLAATSLPSPPFAVVGSNCVIEKDGHLVRGRQYPWGFVNVECTDHCDFIPLRKLLIRSHMCDIRDKTHRIHFEAYRTRRLSFLCSDKEIPLHERTLLSQIEDDQKENCEALRNMEADMEEVFQTKVAEKLKRLDESRDNVRKTCENYRKAIEEESRRIEQRRAEFEREKSSDMDYVSIKSSDTSNGTFKSRKSLFY